MTERRVAEAIDTVVRSIISEVLENPWYHDIHWEAYAPDVGEDDWDAIENSLTKYAPEKPEPDELQEALSLLEERVVRQ